MKQNVQPRFRRKSLWRRLVTPRRIALLGILSVICLGAFTYFYFKYSRVIDAKLRGDVLIRTSGIYAHPRVVKTGESLALADVRRMLDAAGYVEANKGGDERRGRYAVTGTTLSVEPGQDAIVDGTPLFQPVDITFSKSGESIVRLTDRTSKRALQSVELEPELLASLSNSEHEKRKIVQYEDLPANLVNAVVAIEDRRFFEHRGVDYRGLARAVWINVTNRETQQGGSTLTQQLVKNLILTPEKTYKRKLQEAFIAIVLETRLNKNQIFQLYANEIFLGQQGNYSINGMGEAADAYFGKDVTNLNLPECAFLAGIIRGPSLYSPYSNPEKSLERRNNVLDAMVETGAISPEAAEAAKKTELGVRSKRALANSNAPYFVDYMQEELAQTFSEEELSRQALRIYSTVDLDLQRAAEQAVRDNLASLDKVFANRRVDPVPPGTLQASLVCLDAHTGEILAMVGGRDYEQSQLNRAVDAHRQPGSVFKPIVYAAAIDTAFNGAASPPLTAISPFLDAPEKFTYGNGQIYEPGNFGDKYSNRDLPMREGLVHSLNVVTVRVADKIGIFQVQQTATKLGLPKPPPFPATALGTTEATPLEVAEAYTAFADLGQRATPTGLRRVTSADGTTVSEHKPALFPALQPSVAYILTDFMKDVLNRGTAAGARDRGFKATAAGKTGTSRDGWFAGYTPNVVCVVWVGFDDNSQLGLEGAKSALPIWTDFMKAALRIRPDLGGDEFPKPESGVVEVDVDPDGGGLATPGCTTHKKELFVQGTEPTGPCPLHESSAAASPLTEDGEYSIPPYKQGTPPPPPGTDQPDVSAPPAPPGHKGGASAPPPGDRPRRVAPPPGGPPD